ncbi:MAG: hypothetical protein QOJ64_4290 [Acidobacteriota bacterium]|jgi:hypothetical protein|nr:hypothetical protein [Acidobacteriota bacterium]
MDGKGQRRTVRGLISARKWTLSHNGNWRSTKPDSRPTILAKRHQTDFVEVGCRAVLCCTFTLLSFQAPPQAGDIAVWRRPEMPLIFATEM